MAQANLNMSYYPGGFAQGMVIRGVPLVQTHPGKILWVDNSVPGNNDRFTNGSDGNKGTYNSPYATLGYALSQARSNKGDIIFIKPGHAETYSAAAALNVTTVGVAVIGLGFGSNRPTFTLDTGNTTTITIAANNVMFSNCVFLANFLNIATCFNIVNAQVSNDFVVDNCEFRNNSVILNFVACVKVGTTANIADGLTLTNNKMFDIAAGLTTVPAGQTFLVTASIINRLQVTDNLVIYTKTLADTATLIAAGALDLTNAYIARNRTFRPSTSTTGALISSSSTASSGLVADNYAWHLDNSSGLLAPTGTKLGFFNNYCPITGAADVSGLINPAAA